MDWSLPEWESSVKTLEIPKKSSAFMASIARERENAQCKSND